MPIISQNWNHTIPQFGLFKYMYFLNFLFIHFGMSNASLSCINNVVICVIALSTQLIICMEFPIV